MSSYDLVLVGNGILSYVSALKLKAKYPALKMAIIGPEEQTYSASVAAGAMQAVFCEVEDTFHQLPRDREIFKIGLEARAGWHQLLAEFGLKEIVTADSTIMYRRKQSAPFEKVNFETACGVAQDYGCLEDATKQEVERIFCGNLRGEDVIAKKFVGEFALDPKIFFEKAQVILESRGVNFINARVSKIDKISQGIQIKLTNNENIFAERVIVAAGTESSKILPSEFPLVPLFHAVGTAMVLDSAPSKYTNLNFVVRTPNRGGAQCGMHIVPRVGEKFYLGAGNYLSDREPAHRVETIRYLIDICENELFGKQVIYNAKALMLLGSRPKSVDGYPIVGSCEAFPEIYVATGTYRIGLTIAPTVAVDICNWYDGKSSDKFKNWSPARQLHSYASLEVATQYYSESRVSNLIEHGLLDPQQSNAVADKKAELEEISRKLNAEILEKHKLPKGFVVDPDMYSILAASAN